MMRRGVLLIVMLSCASLATGCRCCGLLDPYANTVDDLSDTHVYFDDWYSPRWDISRAGKPDWCGPNNSHVCGNICYLGCYDRYDDCNLYPPSYPYMYPGSSLPQPAAWTPKPSTDPSHKGPTHAPLTLPPVPFPEPVE